MIGSRPLGFLFIHNPKAAGTSISTALQRASAGRGCEFCGFDGLPIHKHATAAEIIETIGEACFGRLLTLMVVRNPWDRLHSWFEFRRATARQRIEAISRDESVKPGVTLEREERLLEQMEQLGFSDWILENDLVDHRGRRLTGTPQRTWGQDREGELVVDVVGRFEELDAFMTEVGERLGLPVELPHLNRSGKPSYRDAYSRAARDHVAEVFAPDIALAAYSF